MLINGSKKNKNYTNKRLKIVYLINCRIVPAEVFEEVNMKLITCIWTLIVLSISNSQALETDNYLTWVMELKDSKNMINQYVNNVIQESLEKTNKRKKPRSCRVLTKKIGNKFRTVPPFIHPLEDFLKANLTEDFIYPDSRKYRPISIYNDRYRWYLRFNGLAQNINVNGIYIGTDKLSHFVSTGRRYFNHYHKKLRKGFTVQEAIDSSIEFGLHNENSILGKWSSGVFSYGDMEANYQGLMFFLGLCSSDQENYLAFEEGKWIQKKQFDITKYISPYWDETYNLSRRNPKNWEKVAPFLKENYCPLKDSELVTKRFAYYDSFNHSSYSIEYIKGLWSKTGDEAVKFAPNPYIDQSFVDLCSEGQ